jgi:hypothetical protein
MHVSPLEIYAIREVCGIHCKRCPAGNTVMAVLIRASDKKTLYNDLSYQIKHLKPKLD